MGGMTRLLPILPLRDIVVFPHRIVPLFVGRDKSVAALEAAMGADKELFLVAQLDPSEDQFYVPGNTRQLFEVSGMKFGVPRLVQGITRDLFLADADIHQASLAGYDVRELVDDEWTE